MKQNASYRRVIRVVALWLAATAMLTANALPLTEAQSTKNSGFIAEIPTSAAAPSAHDSADAAPSLPQLSRTWLFGAGRGAIYDAYLSPLDYCGPSATISMQNERTPRWGGGRVTQLTQWGLNATYASNPGGNGQFYDGQLNVGFGWHYHIGAWANQPWDLALGGLAEFSGGGTYSTRNGNNPAQGRASFDVAPSAIFSYFFPAPRRLRVHCPSPCAGTVVERLCEVRVQLDVPLVGLMFSPQYGQSYYEIFSLGHYDHNVCATYPLNAPSARLLATLHVPVSRRSSFTLGYRGEAQQSKVNKLGRHTWQNGAVVGFTRQF